MLTYSDDDSSSRQLTVTRIYSDEEGESHFGSFTVSMTGSGQCVISGLIVHTV